MSQQAKQLIAQNRQQHNIANHQAARRLDLGKCELTDLQAQVPELFELGWLEELVLSDDWPEWNEKMQTWVQQKSSNEGKKNILTHLPPAMAQLRVLRVLALNNNQISDLSPLAKLSNLTNLQLRGNKISDISPLAGLSNLTRLNLQNNQISDISPLAKLSYLTNLQLRNNQISDISSLAGLSNLTGLGLDKNQISDISPLAKLSNLTRLGLSGNQISDLSPLAKLSNLTTLHLISNQISDISPLAGLSNLTNLDLSSNQISDISPLAGLSNLTNLQLWGNQTSDLSPLAKLSNLTNLRLEYNQISDISSLAGLSNLTGLGLDKNQISDISPLAKLSNLIRLGLSHNQISDISPLFPLLQRINPLFPLLQSTNSLSRLVANWNNGHINIADNPLTTPPMEVVKQGTEAVLRYFEALETYGQEKLYEAKMLIIGEGGSGKTTLYRKLTQGKDAPMPEENDTTRGIDIHKDEFDLADKNKKFIMHIWDFGGQEIYHATHQFFLTKNSLYVLLTDNRREENNDYWLQVQELYGDKSPLVVVQNEKSGRKKELPLKEIRQAFANVTEQYFALDLSLSRTSDAAILNELQDFLRKQIQSLPQIGEVLPIPWARVRAALQKLTTAGTEYITQKELLALCAEHGITEKIRALDLSKTLHNLGVLLHFTDDILLTQTVFLQNTWVTEGVYALTDALNDSSKLDKWKFNAKEAETVWGKEEHKFKYEDKGAELIRLLEKFELCYQLPESKHEYLMPQLLPGTRPTEKIEAHFKREKATQLWYKYDFMSKGLLSRLTVRLHQYVVSEETLWNSGMLLHYPTHQTYIEIVQTYSKSEIMVYAKGGNYRYFLDIISREIDALNDTFGSKLKVSKYLPCNCTDCKGLIAQNEAPNFYEYADLMRRKERGKPTVECRISYNNVNVLRLIDDVFVTTYFAPKPLNVFISYSEADATFLDELLVWLKPLQRSELLVAWSDRNLVAGEEWDSRIKNQLLGADIVLVLLSADALATDYIWHNEIAQAVKQHKSGKSRVIPIILRPCEWTDTPLSDLSPLPEKTKAVSSFTPRDEAWKQVVQGIRAAAEFIQNR